jgi:hypothetical protein
MIPVPGWFCHLSAPTLEWSSQLYSSLKGQSHETFRAIFVTWIDISTPGEEPPLVFKILRGSSDFMLIFNILPRLMRKALQ